MSTKYAFGPWSVESDSHDNGGPFFRIQPVGLQVGYSWNNKAEEDEALAAAILAAAAPELLAELKAAIVQLEMAGDAIECGRYDEALLHARSMMRPKRAAIAKAEGRA